MMMLLLFQAMLLAGLENLAAHRRSNLLSRSVGIPLITNAPGLLSPPPAGFLGSGRGLPGPGQNVTFRCAAAMRRTSIVPFMEDIIPPMPKRALAAP